MKLTNAKMAELMGRNKNLIQSWKKNYPQSYEIVQLGCEAKLKQQEQCKPSELTPTI